MFWSKKRFKSLCGDIEGFDNCQKYIYINHNKHDVFLFERSGDFAAFMEKHAEAWTSTCEVGMDESCGVGYLISRNAIKKVNDQHQSPYLAERYSKEECRSLNIRTFLRDLKNAKLGRRAVVRAAPPITTEAIEILHSNRTRQSFAQQMMENPNPPTPEPPPAPVATNLIQNQKQQSRRTLTEPLFGYRYLMLLALMENFSLFDKIQTIGMVIVVALWTVPCFFFPPIEL